MGLMDIWCVSEYPGWLDEWMERNAEDRRRKEMRMRVYEVAVTRSKGGGGGGSRN